MNKKVVPERLKKYLAKKDTIHENKKKTTTQTPSSVVVHDNKKTPPRQYDYYVSVLCTFKNEALNIKVWVDHYLWMGVDHLFLIDNGSDDNCQEILKSYVEKGVVSVFYMPEKYKQIDHYRYVYENHIQHKSKWVIMADSDEFWYVKNSTIRKELPKYEQYDVVLSHWRNFGTDGHVKHPRDIRTAIVHRREKPGEDFVPEQPGIKYIFQTIKTTPQQIKNQITISMHKKTIIVDEKIRLNHYPIQSEEFFKNVKMVRRSAHTYHSAKTRHTMEYFEFFNSNTDVLDTDLKDMVEQYQEQQKICSDWSVYIEKNLLPLIHKDLEGNIYSKHHSKHEYSNLSPKRYNIINLLKEIKPKRVLEIGFNAGFSSLLMKMSWSGFDLVCVDINDHEYVVPCFNQIRQHFDRMDIILEPSQEALHRLINEKKVFDIIHIDGDHSLEGARRDLELCLQLSHEKTVIIFDDTNLKHLSDLCNLFVKNKKLTPFRLHNFVECREYKHDFYQVCS